jgi:hypothetical protein
LCKFRESATRGKKAAIARSNPKALRAKDQKKPWNAASNRRFHTQPEAGIII